jgi:hypothetical protein
MDTLKPLLTLLALALGGCAALLLPADRVARSEASIRTAEELGAAKVPAAQLHLTMAKDQTAEARRLASAGDKRAPVMLWRAQADGELSLNLTREAQLHAEALKAEADVTSVNARPAP